MSGPLDDQSGFAPDYDSPIPYMRRTRDYYTAIGYTTPYRWAHYVDAPFQPLKKPLAQSRVTIVTTAAQYDPTKGDQGPGAAYNGGAKFYRVYDGDTSQQHDLRISHIGYDRKHTSATDSGTWFPLPQLLKAKAAGRGLSSRDARTGAASAGNRIRRPHHDAIAAALERGCLLEARLQQHRADEFGRTGATPRRIRQAERDRARQPRGVTSSLRAKRSNPS